VITVPEAPNSTFSLSVDSARDPQRDRLPLRVLHLDATVRIQISS
jgi:hypothetical protein